MPKHDIALTQMATAVFAQQTERDKQIKIGASNFSQACNRCLAEDMTGVKREPSSTWLAPVIGTAVHELAERRLNEPGPLRDMFGEPLVEAKLVLGEIEGYGTVKSTTDLYVPGKRLVWDWKGLALDTELPTPDGWTTMGDVQVGDYLIGRSGNPTKVLGKSQVQHKKCYRVSFSGAGSVVTDEDHLWTVVKPTRGISTKEVVLSTPQIQRYLSEGYPVRIIRGPGIQRPHNYNLPIDPYVLGVWLGDGSSDSATLTLSDSNIVTEIENRGYEMHPPRNIQPGCWSQTVKSLSGQLRSAGLLNNKHIPQEYLRASREQRLELLRGLLDTDGYCNPSRGFRVSVQTTKTWFRDGLQELVASLGWAVNCVPIVKTVEGKKYDAFALEFRPTENVFKARSDNNVLGASTKSKYIYVSSVEEIESVPTQCVSVDDPENLYLCTRWFIPTHNTTDQGKLKDIDNAINEDPDPDLYTSNVYKKMRQTWYKLNSYLNQLNSYGRGLELAGYEVESMALAFVCRDGKTADHIKVYKFDYDRAQADRVWHRVELMWKMLTEGHEPDTFSSHEDCWYCNNRR